MKKQINNIASEVNNNTVNVAVSKNVAEVASMIHKIEHFFSTMDKDEIYLPDAEVIFDNLIGAVQRMLGSEAYRIIGGQSNF